MSRCDSRQNSRSTRKKRVLNALVDHMVESLDAPRRYPRIARGRRTCHTTTSSVGTSESGLSQSPLDAYAHLQGGRLGRDFTIINGGSSTQAVDDTVLPSVLFESDTRQSQVPKPLPDWLCKTFSTLEPTNPLRCLLPQDTREGDSVQPLIPPGLSDDCDGLETERSFPFHAPIEEDCVLDGRPGSTQLYTVLDVPAKENTLPFSTPGPGSLVNVRSGATDKQALNTAPCPVTHSIPVSELDFIPFSTPGPGSTLSPVYDLVQSQRAFLLPTFDHDNLPSLPLPSQPPLEEVHALNSTILADSSLPCYTTGFSDLAHGYSSDDVLDHHEDLTDDSGSDPYLDHHVYHLQNLPTTPEPGSRAPRPTHSDSTTKDRSDSDPLQPGYQMDYDTLDFRWEAYFRKGVKHITPPCHDAQQEMTKTPGIQSHHTSLTLESPPSPCPFRFSVAHLDQAKPTSTSGPFKPNDESKTPEVYSTGSMFAPAPGICISPLRGGRISSSPTSPPQKRKRTLLEALDAVNTFEVSQLSDDSIESWRDVLDDE